MLAGFLRSRYPASSLRTWTALGRERQLSTLLITVPTTVENKPEELRSLLPFDVLSLQPGHPEGSPTYSAVLATGSAKRKVLAEHASNPFTIHGKPLKVLTWRGTPPTPLLLAQVHNMPEAATRAELAAALSVPVDAVSDVAYSPSRRRMHAWVSYARAPDAEAALERVWASPPLVRGNALGVAYSTSPPLQRKVSEPTRWLCVQGAPRTATRAQLADALHVAGDAVGAIQDLYGSVRTTYAWVTLASPEDAQEVVNQHNALPAYINGSALVLDYVARPPEPTRYLQFRRFGTSRQAGLEFLTGLRGSPKKLNGIRRIKDERKETKDTLIVKFTDTACATEALEVLRGMSTGPSGKPLYLAYHGTR